MFWELYDLEEWIRNGCDKNIASKVLQLAIIFPYNYDRTIFKKIGELINLNKLSLSINNLKKLPKEIYTLINLKKLYLLQSDLTHISKKISNLINLEELDISINHLKILPAEIGNLINLKELYLSENSITELPKEIGKLINLHRLIINKNNLTTIPIEIINIQNLYFNYSNNPIEYIPPQVARYLKINKTTQKIYKDNQSVHNHGIQEGITNSINYIMSIKPIYKLENINDIIISNTLIDNKTKAILLEYINCKEIHSILNITFEELLINILSFIDQHDAKVEIYKVLEQEMNDTICKCFTGRMSRLINCLNGFDDHIVIHISSNEQIGNIIILIKEKLIAENNYTIELHKDIVIKELNDRGYEKTIIEEWIEYI
jgi:hypothetical protein